MYDLHNAADTERWLENTGVSLETFEEYIEANILISKFKDQLEEKADKTKYLSSSEVNNTVREMIFQEWLSDRLR